MRRIAKRCLVLGLDSTPPRLLFDEYVAELPNLGRFRYVPVSDKAPTGPVTAPPDEIIETEGFDMLKAELTEFGRSITGKRPYPVDIDQVLHGMAVFDAVVRSAKSQNVEIVQ